MGWKHEGSTMKIRPTGVIPPMTTPFRKDGEIDLKLVLRRSTGDRRRRPWHGGRRIDRRGPHARP